MSTPSPSRNDPTPQRRRGDSSFLPVVIMAVIFLLIAFIAAIFLAKSKQNKVIPSSHQPNATSRIVRPQSGFDLA